eukprot:scaffold2146_cov196-Chaetoceros_neogracile.AAC.3
MLGVTTALVAEGAKSDVHVPRGEAIGELQAMGCFIKDVLSCHIIKGSRVIRDTCGFDEPRQDQTPQTIDASFIISITSQSAPC